MKAGTNSRNGARFAAHDSGVLKRGAVAMKKNSQDAVDLAVPSARPASQDQRRTEAHEVEHRRAAGRVVEVGETASGIGDGILLEVRIPVQGNHAHRRKVGLEAAADLIAERHVDEAEVRRGARTDPAEELGVEAPLRVHIERPWGAGGRRRDVGFLPRGAQPAHATATLKRRWS